MIPRPTAFIDTATAGNCLVDARAALTEVAEQMHDGKKGCDEACEALHDAMRSIAMAAHILGLSTDVLNAAAAHLRERQKAEK